MQVEWEMSISIKLKLAMVKKKTTRFIISKLGMVAHTWNRSAWEAEAGGSLL